MSTLRWPLRIYIVGTILVAAAAFAIAFPTWVPRDDHLFVFGVLFAMATAARLQVVHVGTKTKVTVADTANFAAAIVLGPFPAMLVAGGSSIVGFSFSQRTPLYNRIFNAATSALSIGVAAVTYHGIAVTSAVTGVPAALVVSAAIAYLLKATFTDVAAGLQLRRAPLANWWQRHRTELPHHGALFALGAVAALSIEGHAWALVLFVVPMGLVLLVLRETARLREQTRAAIVELADLIDRRDSYTYGHSLRVAHYANRLARRLKMQASQVELVTEAARLHDIGKITTPDRILQKPGPLSDDEMAEMHRHSEAGFELLRRMGDFWDGAQLVRSHHERPDGGGYPRGLTGMELPLEASVISVADAYDAMTSDRVYRKALPFEKVLSELLGGRGSQWHAVVVDSFIEIVQEDRRSEEARGSLGQVTVGVPNP